MTLEKERRGPGLRALEINPFHLQERRSGGHREAVGAARGEDGEKELITGGKSNGPGAKGQVLTSAWGGGFP